MQSLGQWMGYAEVYSSEGRFFGGATEAHRIQQVEGGRVRIDVSFVGPFSHNGHYFVEESDGYRLHQGPASIGYTEILSEGLSDGNVYWPVLGLNECYCSMALPENSSGIMQLSLGLLSRGEQLLYVVVGQQHHAPDGEAHPQISILGGTSVDLAADPTAGRGTVLLHRDGTWRGQLQTLDASLKPAGTENYREHVSVVEGNIVVHIEGAAFDPERRNFHLHSNGWQASTLPHHEVAGSYTLAGGRALSGEFHHLEKYLRVWRREVVTQDGSQKAVLHYWYRGGQRIGVQYGVLKFGELEFYV